MKRPPERLVAPLLPLREGGYRDEEDFRSRAPWLAVLALTLLAAPASAQVPQDMTFTGRLVDDLGDPLLGPVRLEFRIFDAETGGTPLYSEQHLGVPLDESGGFSVQLGLGTSPLGSFDADLFSEVDRWLAVGVNGQILGPRQIIGSVPWALVAERANEIVPDPNAPRLEDCGDGTVADHQTGLLWEKKTGTVGSAVFCETAGCPDPHIVNNVYEWSDTGEDPDGDAFTDFLARLNGDPTVVAATLTQATGHPAADPTVCFAHHCDWHLPAIGELRTILIGPDAAPGQATTCSAAPCIDPDFAAVGGPTAASGYWSASPSDSALQHAWIAFFDGGDIGDNDRKTDDQHIRAVRAGSCQVGGAVCGDGILDQTTEECDGDASAACPGQCQTDCTCPDTTTCVSGETVLLPEGTIIRAFEVATGVLVGSGTVSVPDPTEPLGEYCIGGVPENTDARISADSSLPCPEPVVNSGPAGGICSSVPPSCTVVPELFCVPI